MRLILILLLVLPSITRAEDARLGRLFFSPNDRATMETIRKNSKTPDRVITSKDIEQEAVTEDVPLSAPNKVSLPVVVNGYISRSDGKNTVWVNDQPLAEKTTSQTIKVEKLRADKGQVKIVITDEKKAASLRPGQVYDPNSNKVYNNLRDVPSIEPQEEPGSVVDNIGEKLGAGMDELKKKASDLVDMLKAMSETTASPEQ
jgi:hypothetical protein